MTDEELIQEFVRMERDPGGVGFSVLKITWEGPHTPVSEWVPARRVKADLPDSELRKVLKGILADRSFFGRCEECGERNPSGWMHSATLCQRCAEENHGVVY